MKIEPSPGTNPNSLHDPKYQEFILSVAHVMPASIRAGWPEPLRARADETIEARRSPAKKDKGPGDEASAAIP
jgi:hypothetical protein